MKQQKEGVYMSRHLKQPEAGKGCSGMLGPHGGSTVRFKNVFTSEKASCISDDITRTSETGVRVSVGDHCPWPFYM